MKCSFKVGDPDPGQLPEGAQQGGGHGYSLLRHQAVHQVHSTPSAAQPLQVSIYVLHIKNIFFVNIISLTFLWLMNEILGFFGHVSVSLVKHY